MNNLKDIHNFGCNCAILLALFYQDFNEQFEGYTQLKSLLSSLVFCCFIRISMNNLKDIHNLSAFAAAFSLLFYQDFNEQFEGYTQPQSLTCHSRACCFIRISMNNLKDIHN